jgi:y4mF family transcriptional regulator
MNISDFIKAKRAELGLTQPAFAQQVGVGLRFLRELERGKPSVRLDKVNQVLQSFGVELGVINSATGKVAGIKPISTSSSIAKQTSQSEEAHKHRPNVLVLCGRNKKRSRTAEAIFKNDARFGIRSAGLSPKSDRKVTEGDLRWADLVLVMEHKQRGKLHSQFPGLQLPPLEVLQIADDFAFLDPELVSLLTEKINAQLRAYFQL